MYTAHRVRTPCHGPMHVLRHTAGGPRFLSFDSELDSVRRKGAVTSRCHRLPWLLAVVLGCAPRPQLTLPYVLDICVQLTSGLQHLHAACGVLHRDLKSDNALVQSKDPLVVKWADFGRSVKLEGGAASAGSATHGKGVCMRMCMWVCMVAIAFLSTLRLFLTPPHTHWTCRLRLYVLRVASQPVRDAGGTAGMACVRNIHLSTR